MVHWRYTDTNRYHWDREWDVDKSKCVQWYNEGRHDETSEIVFLAAQSERGRKWGGRNSTWPPGFKTSVPLIAFDMTTECGDTGNNEYRYSWRIFWIYGCLFRASECFWVRASSSKTEFENSKQSADSIILWDIHVRLARVGSARGKDGTELQSYITVRYYCELCWISSIIQARCLTLPSLFPWFVLQLPVIICLFHSSYCVFKFKYSSYMNLFPLSNC
jgi:hypothetical protein